MLEKYYTLYGFAYKKGRWGGALVYGACEWCSLLGEYTQVLEDKMNWWKMEFL